MSASTLPGLLLDRAHEKPDQTALRHHTLGIWQQRSWSTLRDQVAAAGNGLHALGVRPGDVVALLSSNKPEWIIADLAIQGLGAKTLALHPDLSPETTCRILREQNAVLVIVGDQEQHDKVADGRDGLPTVRTIVTINTRGVRSIDTHTAASDPTISWKTLVGFADGNSTDHWTTSAKALDANDVTSIEVVVVDGHASTRTRTSAELLSNAQQLAAKLDAHSGDELLPIASFAEPIERSISEVLALQLGAKVNIGEGGLLERHELAAVQPTIVHVPVSTLDGIKAHVQAQMPRAGFRRLGLQKLFTNSGSRSRNSRNDLLTVRLVLLALIAGSIVIHQAMYDVTGWLRLAIIVGLWLLVIGGLVMSGHAIRPFVRRAYGLANARSLLTGSGLSSSTADFFGALHLAPITEHVAATDSTTKGTL